MANYATLKQSIQSVITTNGNNEITGALLQSLLLSMVDALGNGYQYMGVATPDTNPGTPDQKVFYITNGSGIYANFGSLEIGESEVAILYWDSAWHKATTGAASASVVADIVARLGSYLDIDSYPKRNNYLSASGSWSVSTNAKNIIIPCAPGDKFRITSNANYNALYAFMAGTENTNPSSCVDSARHTVPVGESAVITIPDGTNYLYVLLKTSGQLDYAPESIYKYGLGDIVAELVETVDGQTEAVDRVINYQYDLSSFEQLRGHLGTATKWGTSTNSRHIYIPCIPGDIFRIVGNDTTGSNYAFMPDDPEWVSGGSVTTIGGRNAIAAGSNLEIVAPAGANYLYIQTRTSGQVDCTPASVVRVGVLTKVELIQGETDNLESKVMSELFDELPLNIMYSVLNNVTGYYGNSMPHFMFGVQAGFNSLKADMRLTSDNKIILCHDAGFTLNSAGRITGYDASSANTFAIHDRTLAQLQALEYATPDGDGNYYHPVELSEFVYLCRYYGIIAFLTLRYDSYIQTTAEVMNAILQKYAMENRTLINLYVSPARLIEMAPILDAAAPRVRRCYTMLEGWSMSEDNLLTGINNGCQYICTFSSHQGDITDALAQFVVQHNARLLSIIHSAEEYDATLRSGYVGFQSYVNFVPVKSLAGLTLGES